MPLLTVALVPGPHQVVVRLSGEIDLATRERLTDALARAAALGTPRVVVDVATARFWDVSGLHTLCDVTAELAQDGRQCRVVGAPPATRRLIRLASLGPALELDGPIAAVRQARVDPAPVRPLPAPPPVPSRTQLPRRRIEPRERDAVAAGGRQLVEIGRRLWR